MTDDAAPHRTAHSRQALDAPPRRSAVVLALATAVLGLRAVGVSDQRVLVGETGLVEAVNAVPTWVGWPFRVVMQLGTLWAALVAVAALAWRTWRSHGPAPTIALALSVAVAYRLDNVIKAVIERPRPSAVVVGLDVREHIGGPAFPSGHTTMACAVAAALHPVLPTRWRVVVWSLAAVVAVTRLHVGVHWPLDLLGGVALGTAIAAASWLLVTATGAARAHQ
jgi:undecaprenyl-diphosphatase